jgi:hypothetical protein
MADVWRLVRVSFPKGREKYCRASIALPAEKGALSIGRDELRDVTIDGGSSTPIVSRCVVGGRGAEGKGGWGEGGLGIWLVAACVAGGTRACAW